MRAFRILNFSKDPYEVFEYSGPKYVSRNTGTNCTTGGDQSIIAPCDVADYVDLELGDWTSIVVNGTLNKTEIIEEFPYTFRFCYPNKITLVNSEQKCPPYLFRLAMNAAWNTFDFAHPSRQLELSECGHN